MSPVYLTGRRPLGTVTRWLSLLDFTSATMWGPVVFSVALAEAAPVESNVAMVMVVDRPSVHQRSTVLSLPGVGGASAAMWNEGHTASAGFTLAVAGLR